MNESDLNIKYDFETETINNEKEFLIELVKLNQYVIQKDGLDSGFHQKVTSLLEYIINTENANQALLLTDNLVLIQNHTQYLLTDSAINTNQLCDLILIQFKYFKVAIYKNVLVLLNCTEGNSSKENIHSIVRKRMNKMDGNIYECFDLDLSLKLLNTYLNLKQEDLNTLFLDILTDWKIFNEQLTEDNFEKLLWYSFALEHDNFLKEQILEYEKLIKTEKWSIRFYRFIKKSLSSDAEINLEKVNRAIKKFRKMKNFTSSEKEFITKKINLKINNKNDGEQMVQKPKKKNEILRNVPKEDVIEVIKEIIKLSPYNLSSGVKLSNIKQEKLFHLVVYENEHRSKMLKLIQIVGITAPNGKEVYVNKPTLKRIKEEAIPGYIHVIDNKKPKQKKKTETNNDLFKWPSTDVVGSGFQNNNESNGFNEKSDLRKMGYQITDSTREKRWYTLQRAVPAIGLKKVAYTIAGNIKLRKGQKDGNKKFSYAITEWEHDLGRLKNKYYKQDFKWPST